MLLVSAISYHLAVSVVFFQITSHLVSLNTMSSFPKPITQREWFFFATNPFTLSNVSYLIIQQRKKLKNLITFVEHPQKARLELGGVFVVQRLVFLDDGITFTERNAISN